jgi:hypothetical protein
MHHHRIASIVWILSIKAVLDAIILTVLLLKIRNRRREK